MAAHPDNSGLTDRSDRPALTHSGWFSTTHWSVVLAARRDDSPESVAALERLCRAYWSPLYAYVRHQGYNPQDAQDQVQGFFALLLRDNLLQRVDREAGRFRSFLLAVFRHFLAHERDRACADKRGGGQVPLLLDEQLAERLYLAEASRTASPELLYDRRWAMTVLEQALNQLEAQCVAAGKGRQFEQLKEFMLDEPDEGAYAAVAGALEMTPNGVAVTVHRLRQRFRQLVRETIAHTVTSPAEVEEEVRELLSILRG